MKRMPKAPTLFGPLFVLIQKLYHMKFKAHKWWGDCQFYILVFKYFMLIYADSRHWEIVMGRALHSSIASGSGQGGKNLVIVKHWEIV